MEGDRERWDAKWAGERGREPKAADPFVLACLEWLGPGAERSALDLAAGDGRHALELAARGWIAQAWDVSPAALFLLRRRATERGVLVATRAVDLDERAKLRAPRDVDLIVCVDFLDRALLEELAAWLRPGGHAIAATFTSEWPGEQPSARFRLEPGELARGLAGLETIASEESGGRAGLLARRAPSSA